MATETKAMCRERMTIDSPFVCHLEPGHFEAHHWNRDTWEFLPAQEIITALADALERLEAVARSHAEHGEGYAHEDVLAYCDEAREALRKAGRP